VPTLKLLLKFGRFKTLHANVRRIEPTSVIIHQKDPVASRSKSLDSSFEEDSSEEDSLKSGYARYVWIVTKQVQSSSGSLKIDQSVFGDYQKAQDRAKDLVGKVDEEYEVKEDVSVWTRLFRLPFSEKTYDVQVSCRQFIVQ
jgi:hypothetical protein